MINKRWITLPVVYSRPFASKAVFLSDFEWIWVRRWLFLIIEGLWLARMDLATHSSRSNTVRFWFYSRASSGPFGWIFDWKVREESWIFWPLCCEVWKRSDAILGGKIAPALEPFQNKDSSLVLLLYGTVNGELKFIQNRSKNRFWGKRTTIHYR